MATLDDLDEKVFPPLDIYTAIVDPRGFPTRQFAANQQQYKRLLIAQANDVRAAYREEIDVRASADEALSTRVTELQAEFETEIDGVKAETAAAIQEEREARASADSANALMVDAAVAEALGFEAAVLVRMEASVTPAGVAARYQIVQKVTANGTAYKSGIYFDLIPSGGGYVGRVHIEADKFSIGTEAQATKPFYVDAGIVYIETAHIRNLSLGTGKLGYNAATSIVITGANGSVGPGGVLQAAAIYNEYGAISIDFSSFLNRPNSNSSNFGYLRVALYRIGYGIITARDCFYDDNFAYPFSFTHVDYPPAGTSVTYEAHLQNLSGSGQYDMTGSVMRLINFKR